MHYQPSIKKVTRSTHTHEHTEHRSYKLQCLCAFADEHGTPFQLCVLFLLPQPTHTDTLISNDSARSAKNEPTDCELFFSLSRRRIISACRSPGYFPPGAASWSYVDSYVYPVHDTCVNWMWLPTVWLTWIIVEMSCSVAACVCVCVWVSHTTHQVISCSSAWRGGGL